MTQITGGKITYGRTVKTGDYENKRADVELTFNVGEGEAHDEILARVGAAARDKCQELLGLVQPAARLASVSAVPGGKEAYAAKAAANEKPPADLPKRPPGRPPKPVAKTVEEKLPPTDPTEIEETVALAEEKADPTAIAADEWQAEAAPVTDADLMSEIGKVNGKLKNPVAIRQLIGKYVAPPKGSRDIPANLRPKFIEELHKL